MALNATAGDAAANSYVTTDEADAYYENRLFSSAWGAAPNDQEPALIMATRLLDTRVAFTGAPATTTQALSWPRSGMSTRNGVAIPIDEIPADLKYAVFEMALALLGSTDDTSAENQATAQGLSRLRASNVELWFTEGFEQRPLPLQVMQMLPASWLASTTASILPLRLL
jgi:hypothetical protein